MLDATSAPTERDRWFAGTFLRVLADRTDTGGALTVMEQRARGGFAPPLHVHHREDTALLVLEGHLTAVIGGREQHASAGEFIWLPRDVPHSFRVDSDEAHFLEFALPGGVEGFHVDASDVAGAPDLPPPTAPDIPRMLAAAPAYGVDILGPPPF
ncbi:MAG: cupin domain-containing protein [Ilumatobacter sp.]|nr:cupin domain-containing protein [Ilumatobacter sp.]MCB0984623.1 cupin domain-containing protein [Ilumatobacter sp.]